MNVVARRRRIWPWVLFTALAALLVAGTLLGAGLLNELVLATQRGVEVTIDGVRWLPREMDGAELLVAGFAIALAFVALLVVVPLVVLFGLLASALGIALGIGLPLLLVLLACVVVLSPLLLICWLFWRLLGRPRRGRDRGREEAAAV